MTKDQLIYLKQVADFSELLNFLEIPYRNGGNEIRCCCPIHRGDNPGAFVFYLDSQQWMCHSHGCHGDRPRDIFDFVKELKKCSFTEAIDFVAKLFGVKTGEINDEDIINLRAEMEGNKFLQKMLDEHSVATAPLNLGVDEAVEDYSYLVGRGFPVELQKSFGVQKCTRGQLAGRIVIPITSPDGRLIGYTGRRTDDNPEQKWKFTYKCPVSQTLFNFSNVKKAIRDTKNSVICITEGSLDTFRAIQYGAKNVVATMSANMSRKQKQLVIESGADKIYLAFDGDEAGMNANKKIGAELKKFGLNIFVLPMPEGKDVGDLSKEEFHRSIGEACSFEKWSKGK